MKRCLINGVEQSHIHVKNRGLAYGDGLFTTAKISNGSIEFLSNHLQRLIQGCEKLGITTPSYAALSEQIQSIAKPYDLAVLKVIITAASGGRGYARARSNEHDIIIMVDDFPQHYHQQVKSGITLGLSNQQLGLNPMLHGLKHLNRLEQVLIRQELISTHYDDLLVNNVINEVIEASSANVFFFIDDKLYTPKISHSGVKGIMRENILKQYPEAIVTELFIEDVEKAQAMFICNCVMGVMPVSQFKNKALDIAPVLELRRSMLMVRADA